MSSPIPRCLVAIALLLAALPGQAQDIQRDGPGTAMYIPPINPLPHWYEVRGGSWRVPLETVQALRVLVEAEIGRNTSFGIGAQSPRYAIQFRGETVEGRQVVRLAGACNALGRNDWWLSERFQEVSDGGKCYFDADYRPDDKRFRFGYHGHA